MSFLAIAALYPAPALDGEPAGAERDEERAEDEADDTSPFAAVTTSSAIPIPTKTRENTTTATR